MAQNNTVKVPLTKAPTDSGGGPAIMDNRTGKLETGNLGDYTETMEIDTPMENGSKADSTRPGPRQKRRKKGSEEEEDDEEATLFAESWSKLIRAIMMTDRAADNANRMAEEYQYEEDLGDSLALHARLLENTNEILKDLMMSMKSLRKKGKSEEKNVPEQTVRKEVKDAETSTDPTTEQDKDPKPSMVNASTDTILTPWWWNHTDTKRKIKRQAAGKTFAEAAKGHPSEDMDIQDPATEKETDGPKDVPSYRKQDRPRNRTRIKARPSAVLVQVPAGSTYENTLRSVRNESGVNLQDIGVQVTSMRKTKEGHLLMETGKGKKAEEAAIKLRTALSKTPTNTGKIIHLGATTEIEITNLDAMADKDEVKTAILKTLSENQEQPPDEAQVNVTAMWSLRSGQQIALVKLPTTAARSLTRIPIGWTICRVRPRERPPLKCFRCHGFGHTFNNCTGPDLSLAYRRCGENGHKEKECGESNRCVACNRIGASTKAHRPGSRSCTAARLARNGGNKKEGPNEPSKTEENTATS